MHPMAAMAVHLSSSMRGLLHILITRPAGYLATFMLLTFAGNPELHAKYCEDLHYEDPSLHEPWSKLLK